MDGATVSRELGAIANTNLTPSTDLKVILHPVAVVNPCHQSGFSDPAAAKHRDARPPRLSHQQSICQIFGGLVCADEPLVRRSVEPAVVVGHAGGGGHAVRQLGGEDDDIKSLLCGLGSW